MIRQSISLTVLPNGSACTKANTKMLTVHFVGVQEVFLGDLKPDTSYSVSVGAYTAKGDGARSKPVTVCSGLPRK